MHRVLAIAPHPDDETLGCGGSLLRLQNEGCQTFWLIITSLDQNKVSLSNQISDRQNEIKKVAAYYRFKDYKQLNFLTTALDTVPKNRIIEAISDYTNSIEPDTIFLPYPSDAHSDHKVVFEAASACTKSFRFPFVKRTYIYETLSETEFGLSPDSIAFKPNLWIDISDYLEKKIEIMKIYDSEFGIHPFPRSEKNIRALATLRGSTAGVNSAESFISVKEVM